MPWLLLIWLVYAAFFACLGQRFSITSPTTLRATLVTLATLALLSFAHWLPHLFLGRSNYPSGEDLYMWIVGFQEFGLTPPVALGWFAFTGNDVVMLNYGPNAGVIVGGIALGLVFWGLAAAWLWRGNHAKFARMTGRVVSRGDPRTPPNEIIQRELATASISRDGRG